MSREVKKVDVLDVMVSDAYDARMYRRQINANKGSDELIESEAAFNVVSYLIEVAREVAADAKTFGMETPRLNDALARIGGAK